MVTVRYRLNGNFFVPDVVDDQLVRELKRLTLFAGLIFLSLAFIVIMNPFLAM